MMPDTSFTEPLAESAPLMLEYSRTLCLNESETSGGCAYYHGAWQYLRALGLIKTLGGHEEFFAEVTAAVQASAESPRILVAGSADYSMPAHLLHWSMVAGIDAEITVVDRCRTPLEMVQWYSARIDARLQVEHSDIRHYAPTLGYDLIVTSSLLGNFAPDERPGLFATLGRMLRPGGKLAFTNQVRKVAEESVAFDPSSAERLAAAARERVEETKEQYGFDPVLVAEVALAYGQRRRIHRYPTYDELDQCLRGAGLNVSVFEDCQKEGKAMEGIAGPSLDVRRTDLHVIATKP